MFIWDGMQGAPRYLKEEDNSKYQAQTNFRFEVLANRVCFDQS